MNFHSFDSFVLEDQLARVLANSPETEKYVADRVNEIVVQLMAVPYVDSLKKELVMLNNALEKSEEDYNQLLLQLKAENDQLARDLKTALENQRISEQELENKREFQRKYQYLMHEQNNLKEENDSLKTKIVKSEKYQEQINKENKEIHTKKEDKQKKIKALTQEICSLSEEYELYKKQKQEEIQTFKQEISLLQQQTKKQQNQLILQKANSVKMKKEFDHSTKTIEKLQSVINKLESNVKSETAQKQNERKVMNIKLKDLTKKAKTRQKGFVGMMGIKALVKAVRGQLSILKGQAAQSISKMKKQIEADYTMILDELGQKMTEQLESLMIKINKMNGELKLYRQQVKVKDEIINRLEKLTQTQTSDTHNLKQQLKVKKRESDILRKQLKRNYEQTEIKLYSMEKVYKNMLGQSQYLRY